MPAHGCSTARRDRGARSAPRCVAAGRGVHRRRTAGRPASASCSSATIRRREIYVRNKVKAGGEAGLRVDLQRLPATASLDELLALVERLNASADHDGILVQSPLPRGDGARTPRSASSTRSTRRRTSTAFIPMNVGRLVQGRPHLAPCTPSGVIEMLDRDGIADRRRARRRHRPQRHRRQADGAAAAARDATVTICHSKTPDLPRSTAEADILVAAIGRAGFVTPRLRQARRDGRSTSASIASPTARRRGRSARRGRRRGWPSSSGGARWSSATCIPKSPRWPAR